MNSKIVKLINDYWRFDNDQDNLSTWHDKNDLIKEIEALSICEVSQRSELFCERCKMDFTKEEQHSDHCYNCGKEKKSTQYSG